MLKSKYHQENLNQFTFLITGGAGFIGSNLVEYLIQHNAGKVRVLDNMITGSLKNLKPFLGLSNFELLEGDIRDPEICSQACSGVDIVSHQAALGSVPRSVKDPLFTHAVNSTGFLNMIVAARDADVKRFVYASSSSVYGDHPVLPKRETEIGNPLSPYAVSKLSNELYAAVFANTYKMELIGLRYFNIFGPRQSPESEYPAVIPIFIQSVLSGKAPFIDGDGEQTRDFTYVENAVQANILAFFVKQKEAINQVYNVALGNRISVNKLFQNIADICKSDLKPNYRTQRPGDVRDSLADISKSMKLLGYEPSVLFEEGLKQTFDWFRISQEKSN